RSVGDTSSGVSDCNQESGARIRRPFGSELGQEPHVVLDERPQVGNPVPHDGEPVDAEAEGKAGPFLGVDTGRLEDGRVHHAAPTELDPAGERAGAATDAVTDGARDLELSRWLSEREVRRSEPGTDVVAEDS